MPIRPEDFDIDPPRRPDVHKPDVEQRTFDRRARAQQERERSAARGGANGGSRRRTLALVVAAVLAALVLFGSEKPLISLVRRVLGKPSTPVVMPSPTTNIRELPFEPPAQSEMKLSDHPSEKPAEPTSPAQSKPEQVINSPPPVRKKTRETTSPENSEARTLQQNLQRQQAELEVERKRLADAQLALENQQRQDAEETARARAQAKQQELKEQQKVRELEDSLREAGKAETPGSEPASPYLGPRSGTVEWDGEVQGDEFIDIADDRPSRGNLSGEPLPGVPVMVTVSPSNSVTISSPPGPSNQWKRIVLHVRAKGSKRITVKVHWVLP